MSDVKSNTQFLFPGGWPQRLFFAFATVVLPVVSFTLAISRLHLADWQSPGLRVWLELLVDRPGAVAFAPLAAVVVATCAAIAIRPGPWVGALFCRAILMLGVVLGVHYALLLPASIWVDGELAWGWVLLFVVANEAALIGAAALLRWLRRRFGWWSVAAGAASLWLLGSIWAYLEASGSGPWHDRLPEAMLIPLGFLGVLLLVAGPIWTTDALCRLLARLELPWQWPLGGLFLGLLAYAVSWRMALLNATEAYQALPTEPPNCFVATAAAKAPLWLTGALETHSEACPGFRVTAQLQRLKLFEIVLRQLSPRGHRALRRVYDRLGPPLAARIDSPARAAIAWLALRPCELAATGIVRLLAGKAILRRAGSFYRSEDAD